MGANGTTTSTKHNIKRRSGKKVMKVGSVFSGIGGFDLAFEQAGAEVVYQCEIDKFCLKVLEKHFPKAKRYTDVTKLEAENLERVDVLVGGFPCQDLSVAGKRAGLGGSRSALFFEFARIADALKPEWLIIENVPGLLSSASGKDFRIVVNTLADIGYSLQWRTLDSQYFGVPQRRNRIFIVGHLGAGSFAPVLFEPQSLYRDTPPSREARGEVAGTLNGGAHPGGYNGQDAMSGNLIGSLAPRDYKGVGSQYVNEGKVVAFSAGNSADSYGIGLSEEVTPPLRAGASGTNQVPTIAGALAARDAKGADNIYAEAGKRVSLPIAFAQNTRDEVRLVNGDGSIVGALQSQPGMKQQSYVANVPITTLRTSHTKANGPNVKSDGTSYTLEASEAQGLPVLAPTLSASGSGTERPVRQGAEPGFYVPVAPTLKTHKGSGWAVNSEEARDGALQVQGYGVRRLTPQECEILQAFPVGWTCLCDPPCTSASEKHCPDGPRYKALGNAVTVSVVEWIARRIEGNQHATR